MKNRHYSPRAQVLLALERANWEDVGWWAGGPPEQRASREAPEYSRVTAAAFLSSCLLENLHPTPRASRARRQCLPTHSDLLGKVLHTFPPLILPVSLPTPGTQAG